MQWKKVTYIKNKVMTKEYKELLLKDLCARLPYNIKCIYYDKCVDEEDEGTITGMQNGTYFVIDGGCIDVENIKPYLFPLESITIKQKEELSKLGVSYCEYALHDDTRGLGIMIDEAYIFYEFCYKHHIDFLDLIEKGLAIDATGLNIY